MTYETHKPANLLASRCILYRQSEFKRRIPPHLCSDGCRVCEAYARYRRDQVADRAGMLMWLAPVVVAALAAALIVALWVK